ncbi:MBL fold metallo-hydrolase [Streptomyces carpaticus]|uniref:Ribonuclease BN, tRNA processing enzyme n=2 Tax=Streptomyces TaxID=1883 RepID=A0A1I6U931_9ACTN|nr:MULTISPECIES: MBL fold metallo-hydrolase [Streptomyces]MCK1815822.1 MBL fold metallo-hydrolase [Streptomyces sp. XM4011]QKV70711.1 MBL fold metallo-hydrolase [Streptomyces harbinensis]UWM51145.1 MBL fold metallo-hydrolase [Streptomyces carpaticus]SFS97921.1 Ribonuclease BN, tRNA processing enzyme [Streptomyces harbinensis]
MKLTVVGCSGSFPSADSACSSYLIEAEGYRLLLDLGNGALGELQKYTGLYDIDAIAISHLHPDHCIDMCAYFVARYYRYEGGRCEPIPVYGPQNTERRLTTAYDDTPSEKSMSEVFDFRPLTAGGTFRLGPLTIRTDRVTHPVETYGFRVEHRGRTLCYSGDTGECGNLTELARDSDLFLCEASFTHGKEDIGELHLNGRQAGECAERAGARQLVLTHIPPWTDPLTNLRDARAAFGGPVELARPGAVYRV